MKNPIIITTPRTGSTVICNLLHNIAKQKYGHKNNLSEYFIVNTIDFAYNSKNVDYIDNGIKIVRIEGLLDRSKSVEEIIHKRLQTLKSNPLHTIKAFASDLTPDVKKFIIDTYDPIYLERKDKLEQFLSFASIKHNKKTHYDKDSTDTVKEFKIGATQIKPFVNLIKQYNELKIEKPGITLYYEDFMEAGGDQNALLTLLNIDGEGLSDCSIQTKPSPYDGKYEDLVINKQFWFMYKGVLGDMLA
jgi:LPS sulfotransferase NodH